MGKKHAGEPRFICSSKIFEEPKVSLPNTDAFFKYKIPLQLSPAPPHIWTKTIKQKEGASSMQGRNVATWVVNTKGK